MGYRYPPPPLPPPRPPGSVDFDAHCRPIDRDGPADDLNALLNDILEEERARRELLARLVSFGIGFVVGVAASLIAWLLLLS